MTKLFVFALVAPTAYFLDVLAWLVWIYCANNVQQCLDWGMR